MELALGCRKMGELGLNTPKLAFFFLKKIPFTGAGRAVSTSFGFWWDLLAKPLQRREIKSLTLTHLRASGTAFPARCAPRSDSTAGKGRRGLPMAHHGRQEHLGPQEHPRSPGASPASHSGCPGRVPPSLRSVQGRAERVPVPAVSPGQRVEPSAAAPVPAPGR